MTEQPTAVHHPADRGKAAAAETLVEQHAWLATSMARRASRRRADEDDLAQVALIGLWEAARRFDPDRGLPFAAFASSVIAGRIKRHKRDHSRTIRLSRAAHDAYFTVDAALEELTSHLHRSPTLEEIAHHTGLREDQVLLGMEAAHRSTVQSLDAPAGHGGAPEPSTDDPGVTKVVQRDELASLITVLSPRERRIVALRFFGEHSQREIAEAVGVSQMQISRILAGALDKLRRAAESAERRSARVGLRPAAPGHGGARSHLRAAPLDARVAG